MKHRLERFWYWNKETIMFIMFGAVFLVGVVYLLLSMQANTYKYNCELDRKPNYHTTFFIADDQYAYDPEGFCIFLKQKMEQE